MFVSQNKTGEQEQKHPKSKIINKRGLWQGSVYFTGDILAATDRLELLCHQSKIQSPGMT